MPTAHVLDLAAALGRHVQVPAGDIGERNVFRPVKAIEIGETDRRTNSVQVIRPSAEGCRRAAHLRPPSERPH
jgi:hypothetical protein